MHFELVNIKIIRSNCKDIKELFDPNFDSKSINLSRGAYIRYEKDILIIFLKFIFDLNIKGNQEVLGEFDFSFTFGVDNLDVLRSNLDDYKNFETTVVGLAYGTARGIIFSETLGFTLNNLYLGPLYPSEVNNLIKNRQNYNEE